MGFYCFWPSGDFDNEFKEPDHCIMEQENTNIPDKKRTAEELCRDINLRAEELYLSSKKTKFIDLIILVALGVFMALNWQWIVDNVWWWPWLGVLIVGEFVFFKIHQKLIKGMKSAASAKQNLHLAKWLKRSVLTRNAFYFIFGFAPAILKLVRGENYGALLLIVGLLFLLSYNISPIDSAFSNDLDELEYRLDD